MIGRPPPTPFAPFFVDNGGYTDAHLNLALEKYVLRHKMAGDDLLLFYVNAPAIIIGRNQNTVEEIAADVVAARGIRVVRRVSGGGAVYHDLDNLTFSFMTHDVSGRFNRYDKFNGGRGDARARRPGRDQRPERHFSPAAGRSPATRSSRLPTACSATGPSCWTRISTT